MRTPADSSGQASRTGIEPPLNGGVEPGADGVASFPSRHGWWKRNVRRFVQLPMILLTATRIDLIGRFRFTIEVDGAVHASTGDAIKAAKILFDLGVESPLQLVEHVREWGSVEIVTSAPEESGPPSG